MIFELIGALVLVSAVSLIGIFTLGFGLKKIAPWLEMMVAFAIGAILGDVFIHLLPELSTEGFSLEISLTILLGIIVFFVLEKVVHWHHCHHLEHGGTCSRFTYMSLFGDTLHNAIDGIILAGAFLASPILGVSTTIAILLHEVPQEIGDFGILLKGGFSKKKALGFNFLTALTAFVGAGIAVLFSATIQGATPLLVAFASGSFLYIAGTDLFPELHKEFSSKKAVLQLICILLGIAVMALLLLIG